MFSLNQIKAPEGANKKPKRVGRGESSGHGKTCCRGGKGQTARKGNSKPRLGFEGGQVPMYRRTPKRGFHCWTSKDFEIVNLSDLDVTSSELFNTEFLKDKGLITGTKPYKILADGSLSKKIVVEAHKFSDSAKSKIELAGGRAVIIQ